MNSGQVLNCGTYYPVEVATVNKTKQPYNRLVSLTVGR